MMDSDLAALYGVTTKRLNEQVKRNRSRFPARYMFQLTPHEKRDVVAKMRPPFAARFSHALPYAFTEQGAIMLASGSHSNTAVAASIAVVDAFVRFRECLAITKIWRANSRSRIQIRRSI